MLPVKVSLNIKEEHDGEHLRLMVVAVINADETFEASVALCYLFVLSFPCLLCMYVLCVYMRTFLLCSPLLLFVKISLKKLLRLFHRHHAEPLMQTQLTLPAHMESCPP